MLVSFVGPPSSGKTTTAARLFAELKDLGYPAEFLPEQARWYIAEKQNRLKPGERFALDDDDQFAILMQQADWEKTLNRRGSIVVTDSSVLNTPVYMTDDGVQDEAVGVQVNQALLRYDLVFRCPPVQPSCIQDPNRIHSVTQSEILDAKLDVVLGLFAIKPIVLGGPTTYRVQQAMQRVLEKLVA